VTEKIQFDTHRFVKNLTACGFTEKQAEALADEQARLLDRNLATKADVEKVKAVLKADVEKVKAVLKADLERVNAALRADLDKVTASLKAELETVNANLKAELERVKSDLLKWMVGAMSAQTALIVGLILGLVQFA